MQALHFTRSLRHTRDVRTVVPATGLCIYTVGGRRRVTRLGCAATYVVRLMQAGWICTTRLH